MNEVVWQPEWVQKHTVGLAMDAFRLVETQYIAATMMLVDSAQEQDLLEQMLEVSKPPMPPTGQGVHYLLAAPFRYLPQTGSRFRAINAPGIWYGADDPFSACAEIAYWRQRFLLDSAGLVKTYLATEHSMYEASVNGLAIDLLATPWNQAEVFWKSPSDYSQTQRLGGLVRESEAVSWIRYESVRAPGHKCAAVFDPMILAMKTLDARYEPWHCLTTYDRVTMSNGVQRFDF
ncbi:MAG: RES family NAD+ phosphorylase [Candidatus Saccharibacteria bacterium]|nr:RES family NAD+ phosphorylase [Rhodoferax sp.]